MTHDEVRRLLGVLVSEGPYKGPAEKEKAASAKQEAILEIAFVALTSVISLSESLAVIANASKTINETGIVTHNRG